MPVSIPWQTGQITRRAALQRMGGVAALAAARSALGVAQTRPASSGPGVAGPIHRVTHESFDQSDVYCEYPFCSRSSRYMLYERTNPRLSGNRTELMVVELGTWKQHRLDVAKGIDGLTVTPDGVLYYLQRFGKGEMRLMRADLDQPKPEPVYTRTEEDSILSFGTVSADRRCYAIGVPVAPDWTSFGILLVDLQKGTEAIIDRDPFILNPHVQFDPGDPRRLLIQHNRGGKHAPDGKLVRLVGEEGATLYVLSAPDGKRTALPVGKPHTAPCTGHEAWIGTTGEILFSVEASGDNTPEKGNLLIIRPGAAPRVILKGFRVNHVGVSRCGRFYTCDDWQRPYKIILGSIRTGRSVVICESQTTPGSDQNSHPHPYLTPNLKWVIFNSNREGQPHVYAAAVPDGLIAELEKA